MDALGVWRGKYYVKQWQIQESRAKIVDEGRVKQKWR